MSLLVLCVGAGWAVVGLPRPARAQRTARAGASLPEPSGFRISVREAFLEVQTEYHRERVVRFGADDDKVFTYRNTVIEERIGVGVEGDIYHPDFFAFEGSIKAGARHEWFYRNFPTLRNRDYEAGPILEYDLRANLLRDKAVSASVMARQLERFVPREFRLSQREVLTDVGAEVRYRSAILPMRMAVEQFASDIEGIDQEVPGESRDETTFNYEATWQPSRDHRLSLDYEYLDRTTVQRGASVIEQRWHDLDILHDLSWGPKEKYELRTQFEFRDEAGTFPQDRIRFNPRLRTRHSTDLETTAQYRLDQSELTGLRTLTQLLDFGFTRRIYESLTFDGSVFGEVQDLPGGRRGWYGGGDLSAGYNKKTRLGQWQGSLGVNYATRQLDDSRTTTPVVNEPVAFHGAAPTRLKRELVVLSSMRVESFDGMIRYQRDRDYRIVAYGRQTELVRKLGGRIRDGETVRVSYIHVIPANTRVDNANVNVEIAHLFDNGFRPYYRFAGREEKIRVRNLPPFPEEDINEHTLGLDFRRPRLNFGGEYRIHDSTLFPDEGFRLWTSATLLRDARMSLDWSATYSDTEFTAVMHRRTRRLETGLNYEKELTRRARLSLAARYANEDDTFDKRTEGFTAEGKLTWTIRDVAVELIVEHNDLRDRVEDEVDTRVWLQIRRSFLK